MRAGYDRGFLAAIELLNPKMRAEVHVLGVVVAAALGDEGPIV
jgi:hypothetical protein